MGTTIGDLLNTKGVSLRDPNTVPRVTKRTRQRWARVQSQSFASITWQDPDLGTVKIIIGGAAAGETTVHGGNTWTPIRFEKEKDEVILSARVRANGGILVGRAVGKQFHDYTGKSDLPEFRIRVGYTDDGTLQTFEHNDDGVNDFRVSLARLSDGLVVVLEISFVIRDNQPWICMQETFVGQNVCLTNEECTQFPANRIVTHDVEGVKLAATMLAADEIYTHRYANPFSIFKECRQLLILSIESGSAMRTLDEWPERPVWAPIWPAASEAPKNIMGASGNWQPAVVAWFNLSLGYGFAIDADGGGVFIHFDNVRLANGKRPSAHGELAVLHPMQQIFLKLDPNSTNRPKASVICAVN